MRWEEETKFFGERNENSRGRKIYKGRDKDKRGKNVLEKH